MGTMGGAQDWLTGRDTPLGMDMENESYEEWLLGQIVSFGIGTLIAARKWNNYHYNTSAQVLKHVIVTQSLEGENMYILTPKAKRYLELMENENE